MNNSYKVKKLGTICSIKTGTCITKKDISDDGKYLIISGGIEPMGKCNLFNTYGNTVTISRAGTAGYVNYIKDNFYLNDKCFAVSPLDNNEINSKYLFYLLRDNQKKLYELKSSGTVPTINIPRLSNLSIFFPPYNEQLEIVKKLDTFENIISLLQQELDLRKKQLLTLLHELINGTKYNSCYIGELIDLKRGKRVVKKELLDQSLYNKYPVYQNSLQPLGYIDKTNLKADNTFIISAGAAGDIGYTSIDSWAADDCLICECNEKVNSKYFYYVLVSKQSEIRRMVRKASVPRLSRESILKITMPLPEISIQNKIVAILDKIDEVACEIEKEITLRQKQFEYYRDKLLNFEAL